MAMTNYLSTVHNSKKFFFSKSIFRWGHYGPSVVKRAQYFQKKLIYFFVSSRFLGFQGVYLNPNIYK